MCSPLSLVAYGYNYVNASGYMGSKNRRLRLNYAWLYTSLLDYVQYYVQYIHIADALLVYYMLYITTLANSSVSPVLLLYAHTTT